MCNSHPPYISTRGYVAAYAALESARGDTLHIIHHTNCKLAGLVLVLR